MIKHYNEDHNISQIELDQVPEGDWDVGIVGAGPAGAYAGIHLASKGYRVLLTDTAQFPRDKPCGDGLLPDAIECLEKVGLLGRVRELGFETKTATFHSPSGYKFDVNGDLILIKRRHLDALIAQRAVEAGCVFCRGTVQDFHKNADGSTALKFAGRAAPVKARVILIATGASPFLLKKAGMLTRKDPSAVAIRCYIKSDYRLNELIVTYDKSILPGYAWIFPLPDNEYNVGCGSFYRTATEKHGGLHEVFDRFLKNFPPARKMMDQGEIVSPIRGCPLRCGLTGSRFQGDGNVLGIGEGVGATLPFTGEGIGKAMNIAEIAADITHEAFEAKDLSVLDKFSAELKSNIYPIYTGYKLAEKFCTRPYLLDLFSKRAQNSEPIRRSLSGIVNETIDPRSLITLPKVLKLLLNR